MQHLSLSAFQNLTHDSEILTSELLDGQIRPKVLQLKDRSILKLFRIKRLLTSARLIPYAARFQRNVASLEALAVQTVAITGTYRIPSIDRTAVHYWPLVGVTLRDHSKTAAISVPLARQIGEFYLFLHDKGVYFRSIHFNNIIITPESRLGLIDVVDMQFHKKPLSLSRRIRNLRHLFRDTGDVIKMAPVRSSFIEAYCRSANLGKKNAVRFSDHFEHYFRNIKPIPANSRTPSST